ncbi:hypothetical protein [Halalkalicoccus salilacus]|uniref:hypothetical protein n=1 Tax=Halalkalicoccus salilacus TaxID=3117459 RepID=UPI00300EC3CA
MVDPKVHAAVVRYLVNVSQGAENKKGSLVEGEKLSDRISISYPTVEADEARASLETLSEDRPGLVVEEEGKYTIGNEEEALEFLKSQKSPPMWGPR